MVHIHRSRAGTGFVWGVVATITMSVLLVVGYLSGMAPMPEPIPKAVAEHILGGGAPLPVVMGFAVGAHLLYGGAFGAVLALSTERVTLPRAWAFGVLVWLVMQVVFLPFLGWGAFGTAVTPKIALATLILHLVYGSVLGLTIDRGTETRGPRAVAT